MFDQLIIGSKCSYDDFEASVKERSITPPKKKSIKETVPFSNTTYDFSNIDGEIYWEEAELQYVLELTARTPEELEEKKLDLKTWLMNCMEEDLHDPFIQDYHFIATYSDMEMDDSEIEKSTITVTFTAYPYMIANSKKKYSFTFESTDATTVKLVNNSSHRITPTFKSDASFVLALDESSYAIPSGETTDDSFKLSVGTNIWSIQPSEAGMTLAVEFFEEVF